MKNKLIHLIAIFVWLLPCLSLAQENKDSPISTQIITSNQEQIPKERQKVFGIGASGGYGVHSRYHFKTNSLYSLNTYLEPALDLQYFFWKKYSVELTLPIMNMIGLSEDRKETFLIAESFFNVNFEHQNKRLIFGAGNGFSHSFSEFYSITSLRFLTQVGVELLTDNKHFGVRLLARPLVAYWISSKNEQFLEFGILGILGFYGYVVK